MVVELEYFCPCENLRYLGDRGQVPMDVAREFSTWKQGGGVLLSSRFALLRVVQILNSKLAMTPTGRGGERPNERIIIVIHLEARTSPLSFSYVEFQ